MNKQEYAAYLQSEHWKRLRARKHDKAVKGKGRRCAICASTEQLETHHLKYKNIYDVETCDLRILCHRCHFLGHELMKQGKMVLKSSSHHGLFCVFKETVKKALGLSGKNMFAQNA
jgi:hypothetical protein